MSENVIKLNEIVISDYYKNENVDDKIEENKIDFKEKKLFELNFEKVLYVSEISYKLKFDRRFILNVFRILSIKLYLVLRILYLVFFKIKRNENNVMCNGYVLLIK